MRGGSSALTVVRLRWSCWLRILFRQTPESKFGGTIAATPQLFEIGDVHVHMRELEGLYDKLLREADMQPDRDTLIVLGDLVDGGPNSRQVVT